MSSPYRTECILGRQLALAHLQMLSETENLPEFARRVREICQDRTGQSVGYLANLGEIALYGLKAGVEDAR